ncbi:MAG: alpha/beta hydrolase, partial [Corallococcus sp.]|nr:alpha/beta hydrolase [Corallococcus sp.]
SYLVDFAGFGQSAPPPKSGWDVLDYANDLKELFDENNLRQITVVAHSFGCRVALVLAATYPQYVEKMMLVAPAGLRRFSFKRWFKVKKYRCTKFLHKAGLIGSVDETGSADYQACGDDLKNTFVKVINQDLSFYAKRVKSQTLIINGNEDVDTPLSQAKKLNKLIRNSALIEIDGDHFSFFRSPSAFANAIETFAEQKE